MLYKFQTKIDLILNELLIDYELIKLLKEIKNTGSLISAAKNINVSYRHAWNKLNSANKILGEPLVITIRGGEAGGKTELTIMGEEILRKYELFTKHAFVELQRIFEKYVMNNDIYIAGSHCPGVELALKMMAYEDRELKFHVENVGSLNGLMMVAQGVADIAGIHLLDPETGTYNKPYIKKLNIKNVVFMKGYIREQGLIVRKGNPKKITSIMDIINGKGIFVYRNVGSGTRILFDLLLNEIANKLQIPLDKVEKNIQRYPYEVHSHAEIAQLILKGHADVGLGIRTVADRYNLDFIPLITEEYDFVINTHSIEKPSVKKFILTVSSLEFKNNIAKLLPGIKSTDDTGKIITIN